MSTEINKDRIILEATDVVRQYTQSDEVITAVNRASMKVYEGEFIAIVGASGSGKSTLLHLLAGFGLIQNRFVGSSFFHRYMDRLRDFRQGGISAQLR